MSASRETSSERTILVAGATGHQGGAVARALLDRGFEVHGLTRNRSQPAARTLEERGATMVEGDLYQPETLVPLVADVDAVFGVSDFWSQGYEGQVEQVSNLAEAAAESGVDHFVFSGVAGSERDTGVPHFDSCDEIESRVRDLGLSHTFIRPVFFLQNFESFHEDIREGTLALPIAEDTIHQMMDLRDIGRVAAQVFAEPAQHIGKAYEVAGDEGTLEEIAGVFGNALGIDVEPYYVPIEQAREAFGEESAAMCEWFIEEGFDADIGAMNQIFGPLTTLSGYLEREGWSREDYEPAQTTSWAETVL